MSTIDASVDSFGAGEDEVLVLTVAGKPTVAQIVEAIHRHIGASPLRHVMWDFLGADAELLAREELMGVLEASQTYASARDGGRSAIVTRDTPKADRAVAVFNALKLSWTDAIEYRIFHDRDTALSWLSELPAR